MPLCKKLAIGSDEARRQRAELRTSYGNKLSNMNLGRLGRSKTNPGEMASTSRSSSLTVTGTASLRRIASSFAQVSDVDCGSFAALPHEDSEDDVKEELAEVLIRSEPFKPKLTKKARNLLSLRAGVVRGRGAEDSDEGEEESEGETTVVTSPTYDNFCSHAMQSRASERWGQIACTVSTLFRVRRIKNANPLSELRRLREQRDLLEAFTRPFLYEAGAKP